MRDLKQGQQCEHVTRSFVDGAYTLIPCTVRHLARVDGKPHQLVPCKEGRAVRFLCLKHAGPIEGLKRRTVRGTPPPAAQTDLFQ